MFRSCLITLSCLLALQGCTTTSPLEHQLQALPSQPEAPGQSWSPRVADVAELQHNRQHPEQIRVLSVDTLPAPEQLEMQLHQLRQPWQDDGQALASLASRTQVSLLGQCDQLCGLPVRRNQGAPGALAHFNCQDIGLVRLREYHDSDGQTGFSLAREQVNLVVGQYPARLQRLQDAKGRGISLLAWRGQDRSYSLLIPSGDAHKLLALLAIAESLEASE